MSHPIHAGVDDVLPRQIDELYGQGTTRDWAAFTHTAAGLCQAAGRPRIDADVIDNALTLLGGVYA
jgi:hypothetical protein